MHLKCQDEYNKERCPVCNETIGETDVQASEELLEQFKDEIYVPGDPLTVGSIDDDGSALRAELEEILREHNSEE